MRKVRQKQPQKTQGKAPVSLASLLFFPYLTVLLLIVGLSLLTYPTAASWLSQYNQTSITKTYENSVRNAIPDGEEQLEAARTYNAALSSGALVARNERLPQATGNLDEITTADGRTWRYEDILSAGKENTMARIRIDKIDVDLPIYHGTTEETLLKGAGHLKGTSFPVGGTSTRAVITAHRGLANATMFTDLDKIVVGDTFTIETFDQVLTYKVISTEVVEPEDSQAIRAEEGRDLVTLVTCTPLGINSHRILVTGERIIPTPAKDLANAGKASDLPRFPWWAIAYVAVVVAAVVILARHTHKCRKYVAAVKAKTTENTSEDS
ncbi:class C sortase [Schaalia sp. ZJ1691]|uniref:class C sortase n=1 Tax=Schaalia sp. ZJ1691 TaxID=2709404 RepID=UPI0013EBF4D6|nr:class C sortase [Schaalia sp. ZJ1691]